MLVHIRHRVYRCSGQSYLDALVHAEFSGDVDTAVWDPQFDRHTLTFFDQLAQRRKTLPQQQQFQPYTGSRPRHEKIYHLKLLNRYGCL